MLRYAVSADGARIACEVSGSGTPLVCVHGAGSGRFAFDLVRPLLEDAFTVIAVDRRGRGDSTDGPEYAIEREIEDVEAALRDAGEGAYLFGHSYGGLVSAAVLARTGVELAGAILYEPPAGGVLATAAEIVAWEARIQAGEADAFVAAFMAEVGGYTSAEISAMRGTEAWQRRVEIAPTVPRELRAELAYRPDLEAIGAGAPRTLLLVGSDSPDWALRSTDVYAPALPGVDVRRLEGHGHGAVVGAPELIAHEVRAFAGR